MGKCWQSTQTSSRWAAQAFTGYKVSDLWQHVQHDVISLAIYALKGQRRGITHPLLLPADASLQKHFYKNLFCSNPHLYRVSVRAITTGNKPNKCCNFVISLSLSWKERMFLSFHSAEESPSSFPLNQGKGEPGNSRALLPARSGIKQPVLHSLLGTAAPGKWWICHQMSPSGHSCHLLRLQQAPGFPAGSTDGHSTAITSCSNTHI